MPHYLAGIGNAAGPDAEIKNGQRRRQNVGKGRMLQKKHERQGQRTGSEELNAGKAHPVRSFREGVDGQYMKGKAYRAQEHEKVAGRKVKAALLHCGEKAGKAGRRDGEIRRQKIKADKGNADGDPDNGPWPFAEEKPEQRHHDHIKGGDKGRLAGFGARNAELLQHCRKTKKKSAGDSANPLFFGDVQVPVAGGAEQVPPLFPVKEQNAGNQKKPADKKTDGVHREGAEDFSRGGLGGEGKAPDNGGGKKQENAERFCFGGCGHSKILSKNK